MEGGRRGSREGADSGRGDLGQAARDPATQPAGAGPAPESGPDQPSRGFFPATRWTLVLRAQGADAAAGSAATAATALNELCQIYWKPVYSYIRTKGNGAAESEDLTQGYFATLLRRGSLRDVAQPKGKLRTFLLVAVERFLVDEFRRVGRQKRGGGQLPVSIDEAWASGWDPTADPATPETAFERQWALTVLEQAIAKLESDYRARGARQRAVFEALRFTVSAADGKRPLAEVATELGISEGAAKVAAHRIRQRYRHALQEVIAETLAPGDSADDEIRYLLGVFGGDGPGPRRL